jgi:hypothetical protein
MPCHAAAAADTAAAATQVAVVTAAAAVVEARGGHYHPYGQPRAIIMVAVVATTLDDGFVLFSFLLQNLNFFSDFTYAHFTP